MPFGYHGRYLRIDVSSGTVETVPLSDEVLRHYIDSANETFEISVTIHPADRFTFSLRLRRQRETAARGLVP